MGEIGSGSGSSYPTTKDTDTTQETVTDLVRINWGNDVAACIVAVENTLGVNPQGSYATVALAMAAATGGIIQTGTFPAIDATVAATPFLAILTDTQQFAVYLGSRSLGQNGWCFLGGF